MPDVTRPLRRGALVEFNRERRVSVYRAAIAGWNVARMVGLRENEAIV